ncbi:GntR family transcriptional regulator [bacterium]|nr:GntR family transcriptional regulator [bacterium]
MLLNLTDLSDESLQSQIMRQIRARILAGDLPADTNLPSIRAFAREHHVSVITVQRAYEGLIRDGLIRSRRGKGFFVSELPKDQKKDMAKERLHSQLEPIVRAALAEGLSGADIRAAIKLILNHDKEKK